MMRRLVLVLVLLATMALVLTHARVAAQDASDITIVHTPPTGVIPGFQIYVTAVLTNATSASVAWQNSSMSADEVAPMTNLSRSEEGGWLYAAYLPAQLSPTQVRYAINASGPSGSRAESYFLSVDVPSSEGITPEGQNVWVLTMAASLSMAVSVIAVMYWYTGRRLRRGG